MLTNQEESEIGKMFKELDEDGNGKLSKDELAAACTKFGLISLEDVDQIFEKCDMDGSGFIDYSEFLAVSMTWSKVLKQEKIKMIFEFFHAGKNGNLTLEELKSYFPQASEEEWKEFLSQIDTNGDGDISLEEFRDYLTKYIQG